MTTTREFKQEQRGVAVAMGSALATAIVVLGLVASLADHTAWTANFLSRLEFALRAELLVIAWLAAAIANVARLRFFSPDDIAGSGSGAGSEKIRAAGAILQNTLEQVGLAVVAHLVVAASFIWSSVLIVALVSLFVIGRFLFWLGYRHGARGRAFGFALTFYPTVLALLASATATLLTWIA